MKVGSSGIKMCSSELEGEGQKRWIVWFSSSDWGGVGWRMEIDTDSSQPTFDGDVGLL